MIDIVADDDDSPPAPFDSGKRIDRSLENESERRPETRDEDEEEGVVRFLAYVREIWFVTRMLDPTQQPGPGAPLYWGPKLQTLLTFSSSCLMPPIQLRNSSMADFDSLLEG